LIGRSLRAVVDLENLGLAPPGWTRYRKEEPLLPNAGYDGWRLVRNAASQQTQALGFAVEWESLQDNHDIYVGIRWEIPVAKKDKNYSGGVFADLRTAMIQNDCEVWERQWVGGCYLFKYPSSDAFLIAYNNDRAAIEEAISGAFWTMASVYKRFVDQISGEPSKR
jgi:hypothetical protein